jgi:hypothetical protein
MKDRRLYLVHVRDSLTRIRDYTQVPESVRSGRGEKFFAPTTGKIQGLNEAGTHSTAT